MIQLMLGDCLQKLTELADNSVDSIVTDPPYGLSFMGKSWDYDVPGVNIWAECLRVLKPGGHLLAFFGTRTYHRGVCRIEDAGFEIRDQIMWLYGSGFPKSHNIEKALIKDGKNPENFIGWGTALKPANEPIVVARKPLSESTVAKNVLRWGTGALNINGSRISTAGKAVWKIPPTDKVSDSIMVFKDKKSPGSDSMFKNKGDREGSALGRWPANVILDEEAAMALDEQSGTLVSRWGKHSGKETGDSSMFGIGVKGNAEQFIGDSGGASRFYYVAKASKSERNAGLEGMPEKMRNGSSGNNRTRYCSDCGLTDNGTTNHSECVGEIVNSTAKATQNHHPTVKPKKLMKYLINLVTPPGGVVLDPFMGSGSTGVAARELEFSFIGIEREPQYFEIARARVEAFS